MKIVCWNVAGIRACIRKDGLEFLKTQEYDVVCFQETKAEEKEVKLDEELETIFPYRTWTSNQGVTQRKGLSGTAIWSKIKPDTVYPVPEFDLEGRITAVEFERFNLVTVYTPNSQDSKSPRFQYRIEEWDTQFRNYISDMNTVKPTIVCGDLNVAHKDIDIHKPEKHQNKSAGFLDAERESFQKHLNIGYLDALRMFNNEEKQYTFWDQKIKVFRERNLGWRIDYFLIPKKLKRYVKNSMILPHILGSDHCPITCELVFPKKRKLRIVESF